MLGGIAAASEPCDLEPISRAAKDLSGASSRVEFLANSGKRQILEAKFECGLAALKLSNETAKQISQATDRDAAFWLIKDAILATSREAQLDPEAFEALAKQGLQHLFIEEPGDVDFHNDVAFLMALSDLSRKQGHDEAARKFFVRAVVLDQTISEQRRYVSPYELDQEIKNLVKDWHVDELLTVVKALKDKNRRDKLIQVIGSATSSATLNTGYRLKDVNSKVRRERLSGIAGIIELVSELQPQPEGPIRADLKMYWLAQFYDYSAVGHMIDGNPEKARIQFEQAVGQARRIERLPTRITALRQLVYHMRAVEFDPELRKAIATEIKTVVNSIPDPVEKQQQLRYMRNWNLE